MDRGILRAGIDLDRLADERAEAYRRASPFPHIVIDELFDQGTLERIVDDFPGPTDIAWHRFHSSTEVKLGSTNESQFPPATKAFLYQLNTSTFLRFLERLTSIRGLIPDPHFIGGGLHQVLPGGTLAIHADFNKHPEYHLDRRLNLLIYLNQHWKDEYGGHLELWDRTMSRCEQRIAPTFNRLVIFSTSDVSFHGHPHPLVCPMGTSRKSLALYYYSNGRPASERSKAHSTLYQRLPTDSRLRAVFSLIIPPLAYRLYDRIRRQ